MGSAWPSLRHLVLNNRHVVWPKLTLCGLAHFLCCCSCLEVLRTSIFVSAQHISSLKDFPPKPNMALRDLDLGYSAAEEGVSGRELGRVPKGLCPEVVYFHVVPK